MNTHDGTARVELEAIGNNGNSHTRGGHQKSSSKEPQGKTAAPRDDEGDILDSEDDDASNPFKLRPLSSRRKRSGWLVVALLVGLAFVVVFALVVAFSGHLQQKKKQLLQQSPTRLTSTRQDDFDDAQDFPHSLLVTRQNARQAARLPLLIRWRVDKNKDEIVFRLQLNTTAAAPHNNSSKKVTGWMALGVGEPGTGGIGGADFAVIENIVVAPSSPEKREGTTSEQKEKTEKIEGASIRDCYTTEFSEGAILREACERKQNWVLLGCHQIIPSSDRAPPTIYCDVRRNLSTGLDHKVDRSINDDGVETLMLFAAGPEPTTTRIRSPSHAHGHMHMAAVPSQTTTTPTDNKKKKKGEEGEEAKMIATTSSSSSFEQVFEFGVNFFHPQDDAYAQLDKIKQQPGVKRVIIDCPVILKGNSSIALVELEMPHAAFLPPTLRLNYLAAEFLFPQFAPHHITQNGIGSAEFKFASFDTSPVILARPSLDQSGMPFAQSTKELIVMHFDKRANGTRGQVHMYYTERQVPIETGLMMIGRAWPDAGTPAIPLTSGATNYFTWNIPPTCTGKLRRSVTFFAMQLHVHDQGKGLSLQFGRNGKVYRTIHSDFIEYHKARMLDLAEPVVVLPGDDINVTCKFEIKSNKPTEIGGQASDEMCQAYFLYYPRDANPGGGFDLAAGPECPQTYERDPAPFTQHESGFGVC